ncbi:unnamed protein product [Onchocerca flexuosa]|uniref:Uncharacterized protein n=1 Tax=Onchocerca flexuosa TaxID=387005 RepID=A0A183I8M2_9BILA|nr:unnamed protein product [Onchocerca flexuosa]
MSIISRKMIVKKFLHVVMSQHGNLFMNTL